jgi:hypothetical protein
MGSINAPKYILDLCRIWATYTDIMSIIFINVFETNEDAPIVLMIILLTYNAKSDTNQLSYFIHYHVHETMSHFSLAHL